MTHLLLLSTLALASASTEPQLMRGLGTPPPTCAEGAQAATRPPYAVAPPVFIRKAAGAERLLIFVHGFGGDATMSWTSGRGAYWPTLVASDPAFREFDLFVHEYIVRPSGPLRLADVVAQFVDVAKKNGLISEYRDVMFVTEGDGVFFVRELLKQVPNFAPRATMIFVAGRANEVSRPADRANLYMAEGNAMLKWQEFLQMDASDFALVEPKPWVHCAVLGNAKQATIERDQDSAFCSTMPVVIQGDDWHALRPSCHADQIHQALRRSISRYELQTSQLVAPKSETIRAISAPVSVPCQQTLERLIEVPLQGFDSTKEDVLLSKATILNSDKLKASNAEVVRVSGNVAIVRYTLAGLDGWAAQLPIGAQPACEPGRAQIEVSVTKRLKQ